MLLVKIPGYADHPASQPDAGGAISSICAENHPVSHTYGEQQSAGGCKETAGPVLALQDASTLPAALRQPYRAAAQQPFKIFLPLVQANPSLFSWDPRQMPVEMQAWWAPAFGHIHAAARLPLGQTVSGILNFEVRIVLHNNPSHLNKLQVQDESNTLVRIHLDLSCPPTETCAFSVPVSLDTRESKDGWRELRIRAETKTPDGKDFLNSSGIPIFVDNGGPREDYERHTYQDLIGRGWYDGFDYTNAWIENVPITPVSGVHTFRVRAQNPSQRLTVALDKSHYIQAVGSWPAEQASAGTILFDEPGEFHKFFGIPVDTTKLANGWHSFSVTSTGPNGDISQCPGCPNQISFPSGVAKIWFYVQN